MLRLHGAGLFHEWVLALERQDRLAGHTGLSLLPRSVGGVAVIREMDDISEVVSVSFSGQTVFMSHGLDPVDHLDRGAAAEMETQRRIWLYLWRVGVTHATNESFQLRESLKIYPEKCVHIRRVNISRNQTISSVQRLLTVGPSPAAPCVFRWGLEQQQATPGVLFWHTSFTPCMVVLHQYEHKETFQCSSNKRSDSFTFLWRWSVHFLSCCWAAWCQALADIQQKLEETK